MYKKEIFSDSVKFIKDTEHNRKILTDRLGKPDFIFDDYSYIEIDINKKTWKTHLTIHWLYRNQPPIIELSDVFTILK